MIALADRLNFVVDGFAATAPAEPQPTPRLTRAQAARLNGAKSRGPVTAAGKARASRNALTHGLLSKRLAPLPNNRGELQDYQAHLRELIEEFRPTTRTRLNYVELLAAEWVRLTRIRAVLDALLDRPADGVDPPPSTSVDRVLRGTPVLEHVAEALAAGTPLGLDDAELTMAAERLGEVAEQIRDEAEEYPEDCQRLTARAKDDEWSADELAEALAPGLAMVRLAEELELQRLGAFEPTRVRAVLAGTAAVTAADLARWAGLARQAVEAQPSRLAWARRAEQSHERGCRPRPGGHGLLPTNVGLLMTYEERCRRSIDRITTILREPCGHQATCLFPW